MDLRILLQKIVCFDSYPENFLKQLSYSFWIVGHIYHFLEYLSLSFIEFNWEQWFEILLCETSAQIHHPNKTCSSSIIPHI